MALSKIPFKAGVFKDETPSSSEGAWVDSDKIRFHRGKPEVIGGWEKAFSSDLTGICRSILSWKRNDGEELSGFGTHSKLYVGEGGALFDVTPSGFTAGLIDGLGGSGYGTGTYSSGTYSTSSSVDIFPMSWSLDNWGEYMLALPRNGQLVEWAGNTGTIAAPVTNSPTQATYMFVTNERIVVLLGTKNAAGTYNPMLVRWSDQENNTAWAASASNQAGELPLANGARLVAGGSANRQNLLWSDTSLIGMRYTGDSLVYSFQTLGDNCGLIGPGAFTIKDGIGYWLSPSGDFFRYAGGTPETIVCPVRKDFFDNMSPSQQEKVQCHSISRFDEIWWHYPDSRDGNEVSRYLVYNWREGTWATGKMDRTAFIDDGISGFPVGVDSSGSIYLHERGKTANGAIIDAFVESADFDIADGDKMLRVQGALPDFDDITGGLSMTVSTRLTPVGSQTSTSAMSINSAKERLHFNSLGRMASVKLSSTTSPTFWRLGAIRFDISETGMRF